MVQGWGSRAEGPWEVPRKEKGVEKIVKSKGPMSLAIPDPVMGLQGDDFGNI